ncbi:uncharacterized protein LOC143436778 isoform X2 [Arvicanthis niloticus]|uniref:uncharacterized protein LOC117697227 isoform X2 n=1 Tax=Arvicanthis niloticus TaxID=61156 RepID=UPI0014860FDE|nr:uncharacterized protein LOC117697227 isoform X2 [Arvicanthis niloticus]
MCLIYSPADLEPLCPGLSLLQVYDLTCWLWRSWCRLRRTRTRSRRPFLACRVFLCHFLLCSGSTSCPSPQKSSWHCPPAMPAEEEKTEDPRTPSARTPGCPARGPQDAQREDPRMPSARTPRHVSTILDWAKVVIWNSAWDPGHTDTETCPQDPPTVNRLEAPL